MEYRVCIEVSEYGFDPANGERFLSAFMNAHPEIGPCVHQDIQAGTLGVTFSFDASELSEVADNAARYFAEGVAATGLEPTSLLSVHIELVPEEEPAESKEPVLA